MAVVCFCSLEVLLPEDCRGYGYSTVGRYDFTMASSVSDEHPFTSGSVTTLMYRGLFKDEAFFMHATQARTQKGNATNSRIRKMVPPTTPPAIAPAICGMYPTQNQQKH